MESSFGMDFSGVESHFGMSDALGQINANAATDGKSVAFADDNPSKETVAHELTHVAQQSLSSG